MGLFGNKFKKIKRGDVVDAIVELEKAQQNEISAIGEREKEIEKLMEQGRRTKDRNLQLALAKRINMLKAENANTAKRIQYLNANTQALNQLKTSLDDESFIVNNSKMPLNKLLSDPGQLRKFLNSVTLKKQRSENVLGEALDVFNEAEENYIPDERIYGINESDDALLSMFEEQNSMDDAVAFDKESSRASEQSESTEM